MAHARHPRRNLALSLAGIVLVFAALAGLVAGLAYHAASHPAPKASVSAPAHHHPVTRPAPLRPPQSHPRPPRSHPQHVPRPRRYTVRPDDNLWDIAKTHLGGGQHWPQIFRLNRHIIRNPNLIYPGEVLRL